MDVGSVSVSVSIMNARWLLGFAAVLGVARVANGALELPEGWIEKTPSVLGMYLMATHEDNGSIIVLFEPTREFEAKNLEEFLGVKVANFESQFGVVRKSDIGETTIGAVSGLQQVIEVDLPDGVGGNVPARYEFHVCAHRGSYITVMLGSETASYEDYKAVFDQVLKDLEF